jgi:glucokinase
LNPIISQINHLSALQPIIQKMLDNTKLNTITTTLLESSAPVKKVTAEMPNSTWEIEIQRFDIYEASLMDSLRAIFLRYQNK